MRIGAACVRHDDNDGHTFARADKFVHHQLHLSLVAPGTIVVAQTVQQVDYGVFQTFISAESIGQIHVAGHVGIQDLAVYGIRHNTPRLHRQAEQKQQSCKRHEKLLHCCLFLR